MVRVALRSLFHERGKFFAALSGVAFAASLVLAQSGLFVGFQQMATNVIARVGGDLWVMARGTHLVDFGDTLSASSRAFVASHPCVERARGVVFAWATLRKPSGGIDNVQLIGFPQDSQATLPWAMARGLPSDLHAPMRIAMDAADLSRLEVPENALGEEVQLNNQTVYVGAVTRGIRSFTVVPYLFAEARNAQRIMGMAENQYTFWALDLRNPNCAPDVVAAVERNRDLQVHTVGEFRKMTADYWIIGSGAGATLAFSAFLGLLVGIVVVAQTLYSMTESRLRELATLKTMGGSGGELIGFVAWQAAFLAVVGGLLGWVFALGMQRGVALIGLTMVLSPGVVALGLGSIAGMCALASLVSVRKVLRVEAAAVFR
jgi:putative ABC transport system permease protein